MYCQGGQGCPDGQGGPCGQGGPYDLGDPGAYLIFVIFLHGQNFWRIKCTPKNANFSR